LSGLLDAPATCISCAHHLIDYNLDGPEVAPLTGNWRQECLTCLETDDDSDATVNMQHLVAEFLAHVLLKQHGMPLSKQVRYDTSKLPRSNQPGVSDECKGCINNWLMEESMDVVNDHEMLAHCHACLQQSVGKDTQAVQMTRYVSHSLAWRLLEQQVLSPMARKTRNDLEAGDPEMLQLEQIWNDTIEGELAAEASALQGSAASTLTQYKFCSLRLCGSSSNAGAAGGRATAGNSTVTSFEGH
jgi:hypothetical protein